MLPGNIRELSVTLFSNIFAIKNVFFQIMSEIVLQSKLRYRPTEVAVYENNGYLTMWFINREGMTNYLLLCLCIARKGWRRKDQRLIVNADCAH